MRKEFIEGEPFGVEDLYAAYLLHTATDTYKFGRGAEADSRRQSRFLYYMVVLDLLREVLSRANLPVGHRGLSSSMIKLFAPGNEHAREALLDVAVEVIDTYLTQGGENSLFDEPAYKNTFYFDLNGFLKWERLGKTEADTPRLRAQLAVTKMFMGQKMGGQPSRRELVTTALRG